MSIRRPRALFLVVAAMASLVAAAFLAGYWRTRHHDISVPAPDLSMVEARVRRVVEHARDQVTAEPQSATAWGQFGIVCQAHEFMHEAHECYRQAAQLDAREPRWPYLQAMTMWAIGGDAAAIIELFRRADALQPQWPSTLARIGDVHASVGRLDEACAVYEQASTRFPQVAAIQRGLGQLLLQSNHPEDAIARLQAAEQLRPNDRATWIALASAYARLGRNVDADQATKRAEAGGNATRLPDPAMYEVINACVATQSCLKRARDFMASQSHAEALAAAEIVLADAPRDASLGPIAASALLALKRPQEAVQRLRVLVEVDPADEPTRTQLAMALMQANLPAEALEQFKEAARLQPARGDIRARVAMCLQHMGRMNDALPEFEAAAALQPLGAEEEMYWGMTCYRAQQYERAIEHFERSLALKPDQPDAMYNIGLSLERLGRTDQAIERHRQAARLQPQHPAHQALSRLGVRP